MLGSWEVAGVRLSNKQHVSLGGVNLHPVSWSCPTSAVPSTGVRGKGLGQNQGR